MPCCYLMDFQNVLRMDRQPEFCDWAFNLPRGEALAKVGSKLWRRGFSSDRWIGLYIDELMYSDVEKDR